MRITFVLLFCLLISGCNTSTKNELKRWKEHAANTTIIRDDFGVPHIYGKTDADVVFGLLYAQMWRIIVRMWRLAQQKSIGRESKWFSAISTVGYRTKK